MSYEQKLIELQQQIENRSIEEMVTSENKRYMYCTCMVWCGYKDMYCYDKQWDIVMYVVIGEYQ